MAESILSEKLAVILHADIAGSTVLVQQNERLAHERIQETFRNLSIFIEKYHGHVHELRGDALLAEFERASDSVCAALAFQADHANYINQLNDEVIPRVRLGIAMGEVIIGDNTITGSGVVLAQRIEQLAESGGLCITAAVHEALPKRLPFLQESIGEQDLKGFDEAAHVYRVELTSGDSIPPPHESQKSNSIRVSVRLVLVLIAAVLLLVGGVGYLLKSSLQEEGQARSEEVVLTKDGKPSLAVLPFTNMSNDSEQEYFADGITEDLITDVSKISGLFVIARNSVFTYKGKSIDIQQVARELGVRYVLEGSIRRAGDQVRINAQLIDASSGGHMWAERYDGSTADVFALQDQVTQKIVSALAITLTPQEAKILAEVGTNNPAAHDAYLLGLSFYHRRTAVDNSKAKIHFENAIQLDPEYSVAYAALAKVYVRAISGMENYSEKLGFSWYHGTSRPWRYLQKAKERPDKNYFIVRSRIALKKHQPDLAIAEAKSALNLDSNDAEAMEVLAEALIFSGQPQAGIENAERAMRQNPTQLGLPLYLVGLAEFSSGNTEQAIKTLKRAITQAPNETSFSGALAAAYGENGQPELAKDAFEDYKQRIDSNWFLDQVMSLYPFQNTKVMNRFANGLKVAGVPTRSGEFLRLDATNKLTGPEIKSVMFDRRIDGITFWDGIYAGFGRSPKWHQFRNADGTVEHRGAAIQPGVNSKDTGIGRIDNGMLCETWPKLAANLEICVVIFRITERIARIQWGDYVMVTETGPHPFSIEN